MDDEMTRSGWRTIPDDGGSLFELWESRGGRWQGIEPGRGPIIIGAGAVVRPRWIYRPVHPLAGWDHQPEFWLLAEGRPIVPTEPGLWWLDCQIEPAPVMAYAGGLGYINGFGVIVPVRDTDHWLSPCIRPDPLTTLPR